MLGSAPNTLIHFAARRRDVPLADRAGAVLPEPPVDAPRVVAVRKLEFVKAKGETRFSLSSRF